MNTCDSWESHFRPQSAIGNSMACRGQICDLNEGKDWAGGVVTMRPALVSRRLTQLTPAMWECRPILDRYFEFFRICELLYDMSLFSTSDSYFKNTHTSWYGPDPGWQAPFCITGLLGSFEDSFPCLTIAFCVFLEGSVLCCTLEPLGTWFPLPELPPHPLSFLFL